MNEFETSEIYVKELKKNIDSFGDVPPPWYYSPNSHPNSIQWRMGAGETYMMVYSTWINNNLNNEEKLIEFFKKYPAPPRWLGFIANSIWKLEPMDEFFDYSKCFIKLKEYGFEGTEKYKEDLSNEKWLKNE